MMTQLQQLQAQGRLDAEAYRACMLLTVTIKLVMAMIPGSVIVCSLLIT